MSRGDEISPIVSIVVPIFERSECLPQLVATLNSQTLTDWEAIIVDDGSVADIARAMAPYLSDHRLKLKRLDRNRGVSAARNIGITLSRGRYIAFLDSDDLWLPGKLAAQVARMEEAKNTANAFCVTQTTVVMPGGWTRVRPNFDPKRNQRFSDYLYVDGGFAQASSLLISRSLAMTIRFREELRQYEDHLYFIELGASGAEYLVVHEPLTVWVNDDRGDRLGSVDSLERGAAFLSAAGSNLSSKTATAFQLRVLGVQLFRSSPLATLRLAAKALLTGAVPPLKLAPVIARSIVPSQTWARLRRRVG